MINQKLQHVCPAFVNRKSYSFARQGLRTHLNDHPKKIKWTVLQNCWSFTILSRSFVNVLQLFQVAWQLPSREMLDETRECKKCPKTLNINQPECISLFLIAKKLLNLMTFISINKVQLEASYCLSKQALRNSHYFYINRINGMRNIHDKPIKWCSN